MADLRDIREQLLASISRWKQEALYKPTRGTLSHGMVDTCYKLIEKMLVNCTSTALALTGAKGEEARAACAPRKSIGRLTLGELVGVLEYLDFELARVLSDHLSTPRPRILASGDGLLLRSIVRNRNEFAHNRPSLNTQLVVGVFDLASRFCDMDLVTIMINMSNKAPVTER